MARKIIWSHEAADDLNALSEYIARDSVHYAAAFTQQILEASSSLNIFADRGRVVPELGDPSIREVIVGNYRLIYSTEQSRIVVLAIIHGYRDFNALWEKRN